MGTVQKINIVEEFEKEYVKDHFLGPTYQFQLTCEQLKRIEKLRLFLNERTDEEAIMVAVDWCLKSADRRPPS